MNLRSKRETSFVHLLDVKLPRARRQRENGDKLYPVRVVESSGDRVKIHYVGYAEKHDEWREVNDVVTVEPDTSPSYVPFELHHELAVAVKAALNPKAHRDRDPEVRIELSFDFLLFNGGLKCAGRFIGCSHGHDVYGITRYADLSHLLGEKWYIRGLNERLDFSYAKLETVRFHLHKRKNLVEYTSQGVQRMDTGHCLVFRFVRMDGVKSDWDKVIALS